MGMGYPSSKKLKKKTKKNFTRKCQNKIYDLFDKKKKQNLNKNDNKKKRAKFKKGTYI